MKAVFIIDENSPYYNCSEFFKIYSDYVIEQLSDIVELNTTLITRSNFEKNISILNQAEMFFSTWGIPILSEEEIKRFFPKLKAVFFGGGSVKHFAKQYFNLGIKVICAKGANAVPAAQFTVAQIVLANKGFFQANTLYKTNGYDKAAEFCEYFPGNYDAHIGILGAGNVGKLVINLLKDYNMNIYVHDPYLSEEQIKQLGAIKADMDYIFGECNIISNHMAYTEETDNILNYDLFSMMQNYTTFIQTAEGRTLNDMDLARALKENPTCTALIDYPAGAKVEINHPFVAMDNVILSPHIAGSKNNELERLGEYVYKECYAYINDLPLKYEVTKDMLDKLA